MTAPFDEPLPVTIEVDTTPPAFTDGYPKAGSTQADGSRQVSALISSQEEAYYRFVLLQNGASFLYRIYVDKANLGISYEMQDEMKK